MLRFRVEERIGAPLASYGVAVLASGLATALLLLVGDGSEIPSGLVLLLPVVAASWYGGRGPGLLAVMLGTLAELYVVRTVSVQSSASVIGLQLGTYLIVGFGIAWFTGVLHGTRRTLQAIIHASPLPIFALDLHGNVTSWTPAAERMLGWTEGEVLGKPLPTVPSEKDDEHQRLLARARQGEALRGVEMKRRRRDGSIVDLSLSTAPLYDARGRLQGAVAVYADVTERKQAEEEVRASEERYRLTFDQAAVGIAHVGPSGYFLRVNEGLCTMLGYTQEELLNTRFQEVTHPDDLVRNLAQFEQLLAGQVESYAINKRFLRKDGSEVWGTARTALVRDASGRPEYTISVIEDISDRVRAEEALRRQALHDPLTGLPNRAFLLRALEETIATSGQGSSSFALLLLDLNRFKEINDTFGHHVGDDLLRDVARRLREVLRQSDTVARLGGDEFALLLPGSDVAGASTAARKVLRMLEQPFICQGHRLEIGASIGVAMYPDHGVESAILLQHADVAMYMAKRQSSGYALYLPSEDVHTPDRLVLMTTLHEAVRRNQLHFHYQPQVDLRTNQVDRVEVLARWVHPVHGYVPPDQFIPLAEQAGLIKPLTVAALNAALPQCLRWHEAGMAVRVAINLSAGIVQDSRLPSIINRLLKRYGLAAEWLEVEITEGAVMIEPERAMRVLSRLHDMGVKIALDDFGAGYSSLGYLKRLRADVIKIDRSFVRDMATNADDATIVRATTNLAHDLGLEVVAEGVEDLEACNLLREMGCDLVQGFYLGRPLPAEELTRWLEERSGTEGAVGRVESAGVPRLTIVKDQTG